MILTLTGDEGEFLVEAMKRHLTDLRAEITRTDSRQFKAGLKQQAQIAEELIEKLRDLR